MKITGLDIHLAKEWRTFCFVTLETDNGLQGLGEAGLTGRELAVVGALEHFRPLLLGQDAFRSEHLWQTLWTGGFFPPGPVLSAALAAIDLALWDLKGKALGVPVYQLLGGRVRDRVLTYTHVHGDDNEALVASCRQAVDDGWKCLRWELPHQADGPFEPRQAIDRAIAGWQDMRQALGDDVEICFDVHTRLGLADAVRFCRQVEPFRPFFIEDALRSDNPLAYRRLRSQTSVPLAAGEQFSSKWDFRPLLDEDLIDFARLDLCVAAGLTEGRKIAGWCEGHGIDLAVHNPIGPVSTAACLHLNLASPNFGVMELPRRPGECLGDAVLHQPQWQDGDLLPPDRPGLGVELDMEALRRYPFELTELPHLKRLDGTATHW